MPNDIKTPDADKAMPWAVRIGKTINSVWYVLATIFAFLTFLNAAMPKLVGYLGTIEGGIGSVYTALFERPALVRQADAVRALPAPANLATAHVDGYAYYEVSRTGQLTGDGRLAPVPKQKSLPDFQNVPAGQILRAEDEVYLRAGGSSSAQLLGLISTGECVQVVEGERFQSKVAVARSGGYLPVRRVSCPNGE